LHQVTEGIVRRVVQWLGEDGSEAVGVCVVVRHVEVGTGIRAVGQAQSLIVVAVVVELVAQGGEPLPHTALLDEVLATGVMQEDDAGSLGKGGVAHQQSQRYQNDTQSNPLFASHLNPSLWWCKAVIMRRDSITVIGMVQLWAEIG